MNKLVRIAGGSTLVFLTLAIVMGVLPGIELSRIPAGPGVEPLSPLQAEGRDVYVSSGCSYCHTQQVRPLPQDKIFGRPSAPGDFAYQTPELLGSERTGPDLTNVGTRQASALWEYLHLYNPRIVVPQSIMPSFEWLFQINDKPSAENPALVLPARYAPPQGIVVPTHAANALVAYLQSLKQPLLSSGEATTAALGSVPSKVDGASGSGQPLFITSCSPCHQATAEGLPGAFPPLRGDPVVNDPDGSHHIQVVLRGLHGATIGGVAYASPMPPFAATLSDTDISQIINYERSSWGNHGTLVTSQQVTAARAGSE